MGNELIVDLNSLRPESLMSRLGESLLDSGSITPEQLNYALEYQKEQLKNGKNKMLGQILSDLGFIDRDVLDQAIARQLAAANTNIQSLEKRLTALQALNTVTQAISNEPDTQSLCQSVHQEVKKVFGDINFLIALFDEKTNLIHIPYMCEENKLKHVEPFPLGEGLTSILIRTHEPLLIVDDTENRARELGAITLGAPAKSWMGVPLLLGGEPIGAMVVQDLKEENLFDEVDLEMMSTLALQVAAGLQNVRLLEKSYRQAERDRLVAEISNKMRRAVDMDTLIQTTLREISKAIPVPEAYIQLGVIADSNVYGEKYRPTETSKDEA